MIKFSKLALAAVIMVIALTACSKVKTTSLVGTYKSGNSTMSVSSDGNVRFSIASDATGALASLDNITTYKYDSTTRKEENRNNSLIPWDLTSEKASYEYEVKLFGEERTSSGEQSTYYDVTVKYNFSKDKETVNCTVTVTVPEGKGTSGEVSFSK